MANSLDSEAKRLSALQRRLAAAAARAKRDRLRKIRTDVRKMLADPKLDTPNRLLDALFWYTHPEE